MSNARFGLRVRNGLVRPITEGQQAIFLDPDAVAFLTAAGITDTTITSAIDTLVVSLKNAGLWTKMKAIYPFVGGTASTHKWNLKDPRDLNDAFRLVFNGGGTHASTGWKPNGTNGYADTYFNPIGQLVNSSNFGASIYLRTNSTGYKVDIGVVDINNSYIWLVPRFNSSIDYAGCYDDSNFTGNFLTNSLGLISIIRDSSTTQRLYQNGIQRASRAGFNSTGAINLNIYLASRNLFGSPFNYSDRENSFTAIHESFNATESANLYTAVQTFQTTLGRQV